MLFFTRGLANILGCVTVYIYAVIKFPLAHSSVMRSRSVIGGTGTGGRLRVT